MLVPSIAERRIEQTTASLVSESVEMENAPTAIPTLKSSRLTAQSHRLRHFHFVAMWP